MWKKDSLETELENINHMLRQRMWLHSSQVWKPAWGWIQKWGSSLFRKFQDSIAFGYGMLLSSLHFIWPYREKKQTMEQKYMKNEQLVKGVYEFKAGARWVEKKHLQLLARRAIRGNTWTLSRCTRITTWRERPYHHHLWLWNLMYNSMENKKSSWKRLLSDTLMENSLLGGYFPTK